MNHYIATKEQIDIWKLGLWHGLATTPNTLEMMAISEDIWDQVNWLNTWKEGFFMKDKVKNLLCSFTFTSLDLDLKQYCTDCKKIHVFGAMTKKLSILKPDKGNGIVVLQCSGHVNSSAFLFTNSSRFEQLSSDPTSSKLSFLAMISSFTVKMWWNFWSRLQSFMP